MDTSQGMSYSVIVDQDGERRTLYEGLTLEQALMWAELVKETNPTASTSIEAYQTDLPNFQEQLAKDLARSLEKSPLFDPEDPRFVGGEYSITAMWDWERPVKIKNLTAEGARAWRRNLMSIDAHCRIYIYPALPDIEIAPVAADIPQALEQVSLDRGGQEAMSVTAVFGTKISELDSELAQLHAQMRAIEQRRSLMQEADNKAVGVLQAVKDGVAAIALLSTEAAIEFRAAVIALFPGNPPGTETDRDAERDQLRSEVEEWKKKAQDALATNSLNEEMGHCVREKTSLLEELERTQTLLEQSWAENEKLRQDYQSLAQGLSLQGGPVELRERYQQVLTLATQAEGLQALRANQSKLSQSNSHTTDTVEKLEEAPQENSLSHVGELLSAYTAINADDAEPSSEMVMMSDRVGYLRDNNGHIAGTYVGFDEQDNAELWADWVKAKGMARNIIARPGKRLGFAYEIKLVGAPIASIKALAGMNLGERPPGISGIQEEKTDENVPPSNELKSGDKVRIINPASVYRNQIGVIEVVNSGFYTVSINGMNCIYEAEDIELCDSQDDDGSGGSAVPSEPQPDNGGSGQGTDSEPVDGEQPSTQDSSPADAPQEVESETEITGNPPVGIAAALTLLSANEPVARQEILDTYWRFAFERQEIFYKRLTGEQGPWTNDPILQQYKFCNAYRASDRVSQYLIKNVIYQGSQKEEEVIFRTLLFRLFNKIETWEYLTSRIGKLTLNGFDFKACSQLLDERKSAGSLFSNAYMMPTFSAYGSRIKHQNVLALIEDVTGFPKMEAFFMVGQAKGLFQLLTEIQGLGNFLAYQLATDLNYSEVFYFDENHFTVPGPGAERGIAKCFSDLGGLSESDIIMRMVDTQQAEFERLGLPFRTLGGRSLHAIDCQNLFCEVDKYCRVAFPDVESNRSKIKNEFKQPGEAIDYFYPPKWKLSPLTVGEGGNTPEDVSQNTEKPIELQVAESISEVQVDEPAQPDENADVAAKICSLLAFGCTDKQVQELLPNGTMTTAIWNHFTLPEKQDLTRIYDLRSDLPAAIAYKLQMMLNRRASWAEIEAVTKGLRYKAAVWDHLSDSQKDAIKALKGSALRAEDYPCTELACDVTDKQKPLAELVEITPAISYMRRNDGQLLVAYIGFQNDRDATRYLAWMTKEKMVTEFEVRTPKRVANCHRELKVWGISLDSLNILALLDLSKAPAEALQEVEA